MNHTKQAVRLHQTSPLQMYLVSRMVQVIY